ncbi:hypothetical protein N7494_005231 [Penicillium frequentans]|uniref:Uncharacterized protein n=1 Tax=Penicillium frequentans TaxID=3151616 RepID=A0AAD6CXT4_9EURO|nr:hypothetical protein N7494_005231 [Penicillium glabrum]
MYEGYNLFQADPIPGEKASWTTVERTLLSMTQEDFGRKAQKRAKRISAAQQYQSLSEIRQAHVNQLIAERRSLNSAVEWSCVYAKEYEKPSEARNALRNDNEVVSMEVILMQRPYATKTHVRTPMGDLVDLGIHFGIRPTRKKRTSDGVDYGQFKSDMDGDTRHERAFSPQAYQDSQGHVLETDDEEDTLFSHCMTSEQDFPEDIISDLRHACQQPSRVQSESSHERQHSFHHHDSHFGSILEQRPIIAHSPLRGSTSGTLDHENAESRLAKRPSALLADSDVDGSYGSYRKRMCFDRMDKQEICDQLLAFGAQIEHLEHQMLNLQMEIRGFRDQSGCQLINQG